MVVTSDLRRGSAALISITNKNDVIFIDIFIDFFSLKARRQYCDIIMKVAFRSTWSVEHFFPRPSPNVKSKILEIKQSYLLKGSVH